MRSINVVATAIISCLWLAACGARSGVQCFNDVCLSGDGAGVDDPRGGVGSDDPRGRGGSSANPLGRGGSSAVTPPTRPGNGSSTNGPGERPGENGLPERPPVDPGLTSLCLGSGIATGQLTIRSREELSRLEGCRQVYGDLTVTGLVSPDLAPLSSLTQVTGTLTLNMSGTLSGLESLTRVGHLSLTELDVPTLEPLANLTFLTGSGNEANGELIIHRSASLRNLAGLGSLLAFGGLEISQNTRLQSLQGLRVPSHLENIRITSNRSLRDLVALSSLTSFDRLDILGNDSLTQLQGLEGVSSAGSLHISNSPTLQDTSALSQLGTLGLLFIENVGFTNLDGLVTLRSVDDIVISRNPHLTQVDALARLTLLDDLDVTENPSLQRLPNFAEIFDIGRVLVRDNASLAAGPGFPQLLEASTLTISANPLLTRIDGFPELRAVRTVVVSDNRDLLAVSLSALEDVNRMSILCNPNLPEDSLTPLLALGDVDLRGNLGSASACD